MLYKCDITVEIEAESFEEAAELAQDHIDCNVERWTFEITDERNSYRILEANE